jgi:hypothetical protein
MTSNNLALPKTFGAVSSVFAGQHRANDELGAGIMSSYGVMGYRGKVWSTKYQGKETPLMRQDGDGPRGSIEVVLVKAASAISKIYYADGYQDGANAAPDCWSSDGIKPDASCQKKQHATCAACPRNAWGSRVTESGKQGKQCADSRRVAVVPLNDIANEMFGGPMLLRIPAASLKDLKAYGEMLNSYGYPYYSVGTRISFDPKEAFPKFVFSAIQPLDDETALQVLELRNDERISRLLNEATEHGQRAQGERQEEEQGSVPASPFEEPPTGRVSGASSGAASKANPSATAATSTATATTAASAKAPAKASAPKPSTKSTTATESKPEVTSSGNEEEGGSVPSSFEDLLENML